jgi:hypothetical protein
MSVASKKLSPTMERTYAQMQGGSCNTWTLGGMFPLRVHGVKMQRISTSLFLDSNENC